MGHDLLSLDFEEISIGSAVSGKTQSNFGKYSNLVSGFPLTSPPGLRPGWVYLLVAECQPGKQVHKGPPQL